MGLAGQYVDLLTNPHCLISPGNADAYPEIVFLGTGSAIPMKIRNVSSTLVNTR